MYIDQLFYFGRSILDFLHRFLQFFQSFYKRHAVVRSDVQPFQNMNPSIIQKTTTAQRKTTTMCLIYQYLIMFYLWVIPRSHYFCSFGFPLFPPKKTHTPKRRPPEDTVADGVSNSFLRLVDKSTEKLKDRVEKLEAPRRFRRFLRWGEEFFGAWCLGEKFIFECLYRYI